MIRRWLRKWLGIQLLTEQSVSQKRDIEVCATAVSFLAKRMERPEPITKPRTRKSK